MEAMLYRVVILGSGTGSNARAIMESEAAGSLGQAQVVGVLSDVDGAKILDHAREFGKPAVYLSAAPYRTKLDDEAELAYIEQVENWAPDLVVLAGFMRVIKRRFLEAFTGKIINLHPSLLPKYPGLHAIQKAFEAGESITGCTVHWVTADVDAGEIIGQAEVQIAADDDLDIVETKVHAAEHELLPRVIRELSQEGSF